MKSRLFTTNLNREVSLRFISKAPREILFLRSTEDSFGYQEAINELIQEIRDGLI